jgi:hypothetical protein
LQTSIPREGDGFSWVGQAGFRNPVDLQTMGPEPMIPLAGGTAMRHVLRVCAIVVALAIAAGCKDHPDPEISEASSGDSVRTFFVSHTKVDCVGVAPMKCLQIRESRGADWTLFYSQIEGFDYEEGYDYELRVRLEEVENPPADAASIRYELVELVSKTPH